MDFINRYYQEEFENLSKIALESLEDICLGSDATSKHLPFSYMNESVKHHLMKAIRHITTHIILEESGESDGEYHLSNALTRITMAISTDKDNV